MELRQLRYFVRVVELGSIGRAAQDLDLVQSALSQQISRLEAEVGARLLLRTSRGATPTDAGFAFFSEAQLTLRHAEQATRAARQATLSGTVSVGLAPSTASILGLPLIRAMRERHPHVRLQMVESMSGHLNAMLNARELDMAVLFDVTPATQTQRRWAAEPLLEEDLFFICSRRHIPAPQPSARLLADLLDAPLILPTGSHGLRSTLDTAFKNARFEPTIALEIDSLGMLMGAVDAGLGATLQPWSAVSRYADAAERFHLVRIADSGVTRSNVLCSLSDAELSFAALSTRVAIKSCVCNLIDSRIWHGVHAPAQGSQNVMPP